MNENKENFTLSEAERKKLIPELRFSEFKNSGEWVVKVLSKITDAIFDGTHQTPTYVEGGIPFFSVENLISGNKNKYISREDYELATNKNKPEKGDILITRIGKIGFSAIVDWDYEFSIYVTLACIKKSKEFNSYYLHCYFQSNTYQREILSKSLLNAVPCKINMNELRETKVLLPSTKEQQKIAAFLSNLDELIDAHKQKLVLLKQHKKGLMQNLFPQEGKKVPKFRFPEFKDEGEWKFLYGNELFEAISNKNHNSDLPILAITQEHGAIPREQIDYSVIATKQSVKSYKIVEVGDFIISLRSFQGGIEYSYYKGICSPAYIILRKKKKLSNLFFKFFFKTDLYIRYLNKNLEGIRDGKMVSYKQFSEILLPYPSKNEQQKIAECLSSLDELIMAQTKKIEQLERHKKGLMQKIFPEIN